MANLTDIIYDLKTSKGLSDELIEIVIEDMLKAAYKKRFGIDDNAKIILDIENSSVMLYSQKTIVEEVEDPTTEILLSEAKILESECEIGDELLIEFNPKDFSRTEIAVAQGRATQRLKEFVGNSLYSEFKNKEGEIVIGYFLREDNNNIIVDLGRTEGILSKKNQSSREVYQSGDRIKALILEVKKQKNKFSVVLSRTHSEFIKKIFELEVPEIYEGIVEIVKIVREPGYRTKLAVKSLHSDVDPIGTCVGTKGIRINNVMLELDNERIDILKYDSDPLTFIHNALSPAEVKQVIITDYAKKSAIAVVDDDKLSVAIGKLGLNVRLANRLTDWSINIKTISQFQEMSENEEFAQVFEDIEENITEGEEIDISKISEWDALDKIISEKLINSGIVYIEEVLQKSNEDFYSYGLNEDEVKSLRKLLQEIDVEEINKIEEKVSEDESSEDDLVVDILPLNKDVLEKIKNFDIVSLYDLMGLFTEDKLSEIPTLTDEDIVHIKTIIKENIELE